jgi:hypothetical protein
MKTDFPIFTILKLVPQFNKGLQSSCSVNPQLKRSNTNCRILTALPSTTPFWPRLRYRLTRRGRTLRRKPWEFGGGDSHSSSTLLMPAFSLPCAPPCFTTELHCTWNAPLPLTLMYESPASALCLILGTFSALISDLLVSCYAIFKGWLLLSQPPSCLWK